MSTEVKTACGLRSKPLVDYSQSILLTSDEYLHSIEEKAQKKDEAREEAN